MPKPYIKIFSCIIIAVSSLQAFAEDSIKITVKTNEKAAAALGYSVGGKESGGAGKSFVGKGPKNKKYKFGYKKDTVNGPNISCGALTLTKNSTVTLVMKGHKCHSAVH